MKKTKIICTIGPKTESENIIEALIYKGMNVMRLNFSHGNHQEHEKRIENLRNVLKKTGLKVAIMLDTKGPEIRTMLLENNEVFLKKNQKFILSINQSIIGNNKIVAVNYKNIVNDLKIGKIILIDDGIISMRVLKINKDNIVCNVINSGLLGNNKSINLPGTLTNIPALNKQDKIDLIWGCQKKVDFIAVSFTRNSADIINIRNYLKKHQGKNINIIAKIENQEGLDNFDDILKVSDGIMIARGDLGVEIPIEEVIIAQKMIIKKCNEANKFVITATHMLESMIKNPRPTRAEAGDVANAIIDGTDAVMLSGESAKGLYPIKAVSIMSKICQRTDKMKICKNIHSSLEKNNILDIICKNAVEISEKIQASLIVVITEKGKIARIMRKYTPNAFILAFTKNYHTAQHLILSKGIISYLNKENVKNINELYDLSIKIAVEKNLIKSGDTLVIVNIRNFLDKSINIYIKNL